MSQSLIKVIFFIFASAILSWILIHVLTIFGVFLAIAYPLWWIFSPKQVVCFFCKSRKEGEFCPFCRRVVVKNAGDSPKSFFSVSLNGLMILVVSILSAGLVFLESLLLGYFGFPPPTKTVSFSIPPQSEHIVGEVFPLNITITGIKAPINTVSTDIAFDPQSMSIVDVSTTNSFANIFINRDIDNKDGFARLSGGLPNPGFSKSSGLFATFYLRGLKPGITTIKFLPTSIVLANNGRGNNVLKDLGSLSYLILPKNIKMTDKKQIRENVDLHVLGVSTSSATQMIFYDTQQVLGANTAEIIQRTKLTDSSNPLLTTLGITDQFILSLWQKLL